MAERILFTDMEGTIFGKADVVVEGRVSPSAWGMIPQLLGTEAEAAATEGRRRWNDGEFATYTDWIDYCLTHYKSHGFVREQFERILAALDYHPGVHETFTEIRAKYRTVLISGGFWEQARRAQHDLNLDRAHAACDLFWDNDGRLESWHATACDYEGKVDAMMLAIQEYGANPADCVFIGDGINDVPLAKAVGISIAFNAHPDLQRVSTHSVNQEKGAEDFRAVLEFIPR